MLYENTLIIKNNIKDEEPIPLKECDIYRILFIDHENSYVIWIHIFDNSLPTQINLNELNILLSEEKYLIFTDSDPYNTEPRYLSNDTDTVKVARKKQEREDIKNKRWNIIRDHVNNEPEIFTSLGRSKLFQNKKKHSKKNMIYSYSFITSKSCPKETSAKTFLHLLKKYWKQGKSEFSLYDEYNNCGTPKETSDIPGKKRGRKFKGDPYKGRSLTQRDKDNFRLYIENEIIKNKKSISKAYNLLVNSERYQYYLDDFGSPVFHEVINEISGITELVKKPYPENQKPTEKQFTNYYYANYSKESREKNRLGNRTYLLTRRAVTGSKRAFYPGHMFEIDATVLDFYIRSHYPPYNLIGQPTFYIIIDVYSRFIIGWHMCMGKPSGTNALAALVNMASDKTKLLSSVGYLDNEDFLKSDSHFSIKGIPKQLIIDQAELRKTVPEHIQKRFNIHTVVIA